MRGFLARQTSRRPPRARTRALASTSALALLALLASACRSGSGARTVEAGSFRGAFVGASADPTLRPARLLPETVDETVTYGAEASGGVRAITSGLRVVTSPTGALVAAEDRLPQAPQSTIALPERLGGGFLFVLGGTLWRADRWLGPAKPIFSASQAVSAVLPGLDRVYVRSMSSVAAIDGRTGQSLDLGPWPATPFVTSYAAADGWRAAAITDLRGAVATFDAGATWRSLDLPFDPKQVVASNDSIAIGGFDAARLETWYELRADGSVARLGAPPRDLKTRLTPPPATGTSRSPSAPTPPRPGASTATTATPPPPPGVPSSDKEDFAVKTFGKRPLATAIEDGWPLTDGTAVVARDGALARIRLDDGSLTEVVRDAFPLATSRCHPVSLTRPTAVGAFGFVCGEPRGTTVVYAYEPLRGRLVEIKRFDRPRVVTSSGNGALAVRGPCAEDGEPSPPARPEPARLERSPKDDPSEREKDGERAKERASDKSKEEKAAPDPLASARPSAPAAVVKPPAPEIHPYCVLGHDNTWREIHVRGEVGGERVVVLADGRIVVVSPPQGIGTAARLTILDHGRATTAAVTFPRIAGDVARVLRLGLWLDGFEERRPGVVGGWIEAGGVMMGIELGLDGKATLGQFIRDAGFPFVSGKYGLGWTASRRGYETTDGGMTWTNIDLPDPLVPVARVERRACGPIGCTAHGWLRVGWGEARKPSALAEAPPRTRPVQALTTPQLQLDCEPMAGSPPAVLPRARTAPTAPLTLGTSRTGGRMNGYVGGPPVLGTFQGLSDLPAFYNQHAQTLRESERGVSLEVKELVDRSPNAGSLARVYGWGPRTGDWDTLGRWQVKWLSPFAGWPEVRASLPAPPPSFIVDMTRPGTGYYGGYASGYSSYGGTNNYQIASGDDPSHALVVAKRVARSESALFELEADRAPIEIRRADGEPFGEIEGIVRAAGRWFLATPPGAGGGAPTYATTTTTVTAPVTVIWQVEGGVARELVRVPRSTGDVPTYAAYGPRTTKLARRSDGRAIGLLADGQPTAERNTSTRWSLPIDLETGAVGEPELLGYVDLAGRTLEACTDDMVGWVFDTAMPTSSSVRVRVPKGGGALSAVQARLRVSAGGRACVERIAGTYDGQTPERTAQLTRAGVPVRTTAPLPPGELTVTAMSAQARYPLRCTVAK